MDGWRKELNFDPIEPLLSQESEALVYFVRRDLLDENVGPVQRLWQLPEVLKILKKQQPDGSWPRVGVKEHTGVNYPLIETWRQMRFLVQQYGLTRENAQLSRAAEYIFSCQTEIGDIRGILANQYATYYTGAILGLLIQSGYGADPRVEKGMQWLLSMRQSDGGWTVPILTHKLDKATLYRLTSQYAQPLEPDRSKPFSHNCMGMVLRAFAAHPRYRRSAEAWRAAQLLKSRFFQPDAYTSYHDAKYWIIFDYPFWWNNLISALDSISSIGWPGDDEQIQVALAWLRDHQEKDGLWKISYSSPTEKETDQAREKKKWISLAICRVLRSFQS